jgi:DNA repair protein RecO (recombination protein O)
VSLYTTKAIVLRNQDLGEADKIVTLYSQRFGKIKGVAKGVRKTTSKFGSSIEIFTYAEYLLYEKKETAELNIITQAQIIHSFKEIREDLNKITTGAFILELIDTLVAGREKDYLLFTLILQTLTWLKSEVNDLIIPTFVLKIMTILGLKPDMGENCTLCHNVVSDKIQFSPSQGGIICTSHNIKDGIHISNGIRSLINQLLTLDIPQIRKIQVAKNLSLDVRKLVINNYLNYHLQKPLHSMNTLSLE